MDLGYTLPELAEAIHETVAVNNVSSCYVRPIVFRGAGPMGLYPRDNPVEVAVAVWPWGAYLGEEALEHGVSCKISSFRRIGPNTLPPAFRDLPYLRKPFGAGQLEILAQEAFARRRRNRE